MIDWRVMMRAEAHRALRCAGSARPGDRIAGIAVLLCAVAWIGAGAAAGEDQTRRGPTHDQSGIHPPGQPLASEGPTPWLDEVRAQRRSWEEKREAARRAYEARRRANNPQAAAQHEAWEEDVQRRRAARRERMDQERELYRSLGPSLVPAWPWPNDSSPDLTRDPTRDPTWRSDAGSDPFAPGAPSDAPVFAPQGWDNHWYFQGF